MNEEDSVKTLILWRVAKALLLNVRNAELERGIIEFRMIVAAEKVAHCVVQ